jgi:hypothetical protein
MRMWTEWQPLIAGRKNLWAVMIEKKKSAEAMQSGPGNGSPGGQIADVVAVRQVAAQHSPEGRDVRRMDRDGIARRKGFVKGLIETRIERFVVWGMLRHGGYREACAVMLPILRKFSRIIARSPSLRTLRLFYRGIMRVWFPMQPRVH